MPARRCNIRLLEETRKMHQGVRRSLTPHTNAAISRALRAARGAADRGNCVDMHKHAQAARALLETRLDALLGRR